MKKRRSVPVAAVLSFFWPGLGQIYGGRFRRGVFAYAIEWVVLASGSLFAALSPAAYFGFLFALCSIHILIVVDASLLARRTGEVSLRPYQRWYGYAALAAAIAFGTAPIKLLRQHELFNIPATSMSPGVMWGDSIMVDRAAFRNRLPARGDLVVFRYPKDKSFVYFKRVIGLPGDTVEVKAKQLVVNSRPVQRKALPQEQFKEFVEQFREQKRGAERLEFFEESLGDLRYVTADDPTSYINENYRQITVPAKYYFVMGDNRDYSNDSRFWGFVSEEELMGRALFVLFSYDSEAGRVRWDRIGKWLDPRDKN